MKKELLLGFEQDAIVRNLITKARVALDEMYHATPDTERFTRFQNAWGDLDEAIKKAEALDV